MAINLPLGSGNTGTNDWADVYNNDAQLVTEIDARDDNYQNVFTASGVWAADSVAGTYVVGVSNVSGVMNASGSNIAAAQGVIFPPSFYFDDADYTIASKTQKLRVRAQVNTNATAWSSVTATVGLYPITFAGGADTLTYTLGTVVSGSTVALANPSASTTNQGNSGDFTIPSDGQYALGVVTSATLTNNAFAQVVGTVQTRWV